MSDKPIELHKVLFGTLRNHDLFKLSKDDSYWEEKVSDTKYMRSAKDADIGFKTHFTSFFIDPSRAVWVQVPETNPNNCPNCDHHKMQRVIEKNDPQAMKLHCYMFRDEPTDICAQHSGNKISFFSGGPNFSIQSAIVDMVEDLKKRGYTVEY